VARCPVIGMLFVIGRCICHRSLTCNEAAPPKKYLIPSASAPPRTGYNGGRNLERHAAPQHRADLHILHKANAVPARASDSHPTVRALAKRQLAFLPLSVAGQNRPSFSVCRSPKLLPFSRPHAMLKLLPFSRPHATLNAQRSTLNAQRSTLNNQTATQPENPMKVHLPPAPTHPNRISEGSSGRDAGPSAHAQTPLQTGAAPHHPRGFSDDPRVHNFEVSLVLEFCEMGSLREALDSGSFRTGACACVCARERGREREGERERERGRSAFRSCFPRVAEERA